MNYQSQDTSHLSTPRAGPSRRPATISELADRANIPWDESKGFKYHLKSAEKYRREGKEYARSGDMENAFVELAKAATLVLERLPEHPDYIAKLNPNQRHNLGLNGQEILDNLAELKPGIVDRYEKWRQAHPDGVDMDTTPVDASRNNQQQKQMRQREEEITRKRREEQEGIARRQYESEEAARAARQNPASPTLPYPPHSAPATTAQQPQPTYSLFPTHLGASSSTVPKSMFYPTAVQYPKLGPTAMPLESPHYEGDSTDSESLHQDFRRLGMDSNNNQRSPLKPVRNSSYPPPVTTTSPIPGGGPIRYPALMSQHQKTQGYYPSLSSMFADSANRQHGSSLLLAANSSDTRMASSISPWAPNAPNQQPYGQVPPQPQPQYPHPHPYSQPHARQQHGQQQVTNPTAYMRPPPPPPPTSTTSETFAQSQLQTESNRIIQASDPNFDSTKPLKSVSLPRECLPRFLAIAKVNTEMNKETCGLLLGKDKGHRYSVTTLLIPKQTSTSDTCTMLEEELVLQFTEERSLITLGWIHTHPSQSCFMSSVDLHTHSGFQRMLPESFAVVCAPKFNPNFGIFRITDPPGLDVILNCQAKEAFHPHPDQAIYTDADKGHVQIKDIALEIVDLR